MYRAKLQIIGKIFVFFTTYLLFLSLLGLGRVDHWPEIYIEPDETLMNFNSNYSLHLMISGVKDIIDKQFKIGTIKSSKELSFREIEDFETLMKYRKKFIRQNCEELQGHGNFTQNYISEVYVPYENLVYCPVFKASTTMWYQNIMVLWVKRFVSSLKIDNTINAKCHRT